MGFILLHIAPPPPENCITIKMFNLRLTLISNENQQECITV